MIGLVQPRVDGRRLLLGALGQGLRRYASPSSTRRRILVVRPDHLGDLLFLTPALSRLRRAFPDAEIVALVGPWGEPVLAANPNLDRLIVWDFPWFDRRPRGSLLGPYLSLLRLARRLRREQFDLAIQFRADFWWGALAVRLAEVPEHLGYDVPAVRPFLTRAIPVAHGLHAADENLRLVESIAGPGPAERLAFPIDESARRRAAELLGMGQGSATEVAAAGGRPLVALQTGAGAPVKLLPPERLVEVGRALAERFGARIVVLGGMGEVELVRRVTEGLGGDAIPLAGKTTLTELAAVLERCRLVVGPDSGPLHLAVAVGTPSAHLYGPADPRRFGPYGDPARHRVISSSWPCSPCGQLAFSEAELKLHRCISHISVDQVVEVASTLLQTNPAGDEGVVR